MWWGEVLDFNRPGNHKWMMSNPKEIPMGQYAEPNRQEEAEMQHFSYEILFSQDRDHA